MCSLRDFPELCDYSLTDKNVSMSVVVKRVKPEVGNLIIFYYVYSKTLRPYTTNNRWSETRIAQYCPLEISSSLLMHCCMSHA